MNWPRIILDGIAMSAVFNAVVLVGFFLWPQEYSVMSPKEIKEAAAPYVNQKEVRKMKLFLYGLYLTLFLYWAISASLAGTEGFWSLFWTGYVEMTFVSISDFVILDCWLPQKVRDRIKGAEQCKAWERKEWLLKLAIPEHLVGWTLLVCPIAGLITAGIGSLLPAF